MRTALVAVGCLTALANAGQARAAASFSTSRQDDGRSIGQVTRPGDALAYTVWLRNRGDVDAQLVVLREVFATCIDLAGFDPVADPSQVSVSPGPATVGWDAPTRTLELRFSGSIAPTPAGDQTVVLTGLAAASPAAGACCQQAVVLHQDVPAGESLEDGELGSGPTCTQVTGCQPLPGSISDLKAVRRGNHVELTWGAAASATAHNVWKVTGGDRSHVPFARALGNRNLADVVPVCSAVATGACTDPDAVSDPRPLYFYRAWGTCADGSEGDQPGPVCGAVASVTVSSVRGSIPAAPGPDGDCGTTGAILPVSLYAQVTDTGGNPLAGCPVVFYVDYPRMSPCGRGFGQFCGGNVAITDGIGLAAATYTLRQEDYDFCNCLPSACGCLPPTAGDCDPATPGTQMGNGLCPDLARCSPTATCRTGPPPEDLFCQVAIRAASGAIVSTNVQYLEYGR